ncbi:MAG: methionine synthase [Phycisphaerales bacterium]|nr:methionine synthase [Phycisphaerales bacterium]
MSSRFLAELDRRVLVFDGAMGTSIYKTNLSVERDYCGCENCTDILVKSRPDVIQSIHESFLAVGADCVETDSFGANKLVLGEFDLTDKTFELNKLAVDIARAACKEHESADKPRFVIGSMGPGTRLITLGNTSWEAMFDSYREQARGLLAGEPRPGAGGKHGCDAFIIETCQDLLQIKCAVNACLAALAERNLTPLDVPIMVSVTIETTGTMLLGTSIEAAAAALAQYPILSLGLNCATGPTEMAEHVHWLGKHWGTPPLRGGSGRVVSVLPNAGLPVLVEGRTEYPLTPQPFAEAMQKFVERDGVGIIGGCCGTTPEHIKLLSEIVQKADRTNPARSGGVPKGVTSLYSPTEYRQDNSILIVGERMNASGSKKFKQLLEAEDWDGIVSLAREQMRHDGAHVLDLNVDYAGRDNVRDMTEIVMRVVRQVDAPLMIDSTQVRTIEAGLMHSGGKCIINSANFEDGEHKFDEICHLAKKYGAGLVIGSIDEDKEASMARTAERKLAIARRAFERATTVRGLAPADLLFDPLVLPISTGMESDRRSALETIEGVRAIARAMPECQTCVGLSNVSFGLKPAARVVLNSVFLHELRAAGLTGAIVHASKILPENKIPGEQWQAALDLIYDRRREGFDPLAAFIELFRDAAAGDAAGAKKAVANLTLEEKLRRHIIDGEKQGVAETLELARERYAPLAIINDHLLDGMKTVGELFGSGQMQLPFVLQSAEVMKMAVAHLEQYMEKAEGQSKGRIVLATVKGDVHDIGKNLVDIILTNNGYTVYNLGIKQPIAAIVEKWKETNADAVGMSGLLVKSVNVMEENLHELNSQGITVPILLGGAALTRHYCEGHLRGIYKGQVFYGKDAFEGLSTMDHVVVGAFDTLNAQIDERIGKRSRAEETIARSRAEQGRRMEAFAAEKAGGGAVAVVERVSRRSTVPALDPARIPKPPFWGSRVVSDISLDHIYPFINEVALFRGQWQVKKGALSDGAYEALLEDKIRPIFESLKTRCRDRAILRPSVVYGYFPCNADGDDLVVWDPASSGAPILRSGSSGNTIEQREPPPRGRGLPREIERFRFPRQAGKQSLCISDFFATVESGITDVLALHCVTMGSNATEEARRLFEANDYTNYLYLHGLGVESAEALAEFWHKRIRQELGIAGEDSPRVRELFTQHYRGSRYSFGYPACPDMSDQDKLWKLIDPTRIGCVLTENWQIDPEQSTSAIIVHHPEAKYFNV